MAEIREREGLYLVGRTVEGKRKLNRRRRRCHQYSAT